MARNCCISSSCSVKNETGPGLKLQSLDSESSVRPLRLPHFLWFLQNLLFLLTFLTQFFAVECVVFCRPSLLQLSLYRHLLMSRVVRSCLTSHSSGGSRHLVCIGALKKLCNDPSLIYSHCQEAKEMEDGLDVDEVSIFLVRRSF